MSRDTIPRHLLQELRKLAAANCSACLGEGVVTYTARTQLGYREVRCACCDREKDEDR